MATDFKELLLNQDGHKRKVGVEIEFAQVTPLDALELIKKRFGGQTITKSPFEYEIVDSSLGKFKLELDASSIKDLGKEISSQEGFYADVEENSLKQLSIDWLTIAAEQFVPWEIVTDPIFFGEVEKLYPLIDDLREIGAKGTRHAPHFAFGVHLNPELIALDAPTIVTYLRSFFCLYEWICDQEQIDFARRVTPYVNHFPDSYVDKILNFSYQPSITQVIEDYLEENTSRNRSLDLLPLFAFIDEKKLREYTDDPRIKARPTFHYRLPNSDIDNTDWNLETPWALWQQVERLANSPKLLQTLCRDFQEDRQRIKVPFDSQWITQVKNFICTHFK